MTNDLDSSADLSKPSAIGQNVQSILAIYEREEERISSSQRVFERAVNFVGRPWSLCVILLFIVLWILANLLAAKFGRHPFDPFPFFGLQGLLTFCSLFITTIVLIKQNRLGRFEAQRQHLELQVNMITEQKTTKLINLIEELRRDLPMVADRHDPEAEAFQVPTHPDQVLNALHEHNGQPGKKF